MLTPRSCFILGAFKKLFLMFLFIFDIERETEHEWGRGRERGRQNPKQAPGSDLSAQSPMAGVKLTVRAARTV